MRFFFLGLLFDEKAIEEAKKYSKAGLQVAVQSFQSNLLSGFGDDAEVINVPPVGSFPKNYGKISIKGSDWGNNTRIGYLNLPIIKWIIQSKSIEKQLEKRINPQEKTVILCYSLYYPFISAAYHIKQKYNNVKVCLLQTDNVHGRNGISVYDNFFNIRLDNWMVKRCHKFDGFVLLTKYLTEPLEVGERPYIIVEGICNDKQSQNVINDKKSNNVCLYAGSINEEFGIMEMAEAIEQIPNCEFWLCGGGNAVDTIKEMGERCDRIRYLGFLNAEELNEARNKCDYLINPRVPTGTYTKYSFPSKTMEYLMSGKPTIMYKLEGIPDEYDEYLLYLSKDSIGNKRKLTEELTNIFESDYDEQVNRAVCGRRFVLENKNSVIQAKRISEFMEKLF